MKRFLSLIAVMFLMVVNIHADEYELTLTWDVNTATDNVRAFILDRSTGASGNWVEYLHLCKDPKDSLMCQNTSPVNMNDPEALTLTDTVNDATPVYSYRLWAENTFGRSVKSSNILVISTLVPNTVKGLRILSIIKVPE